MFESGKKDQDPEKKAEAPGLVYELMKGMAGICLLVSVLATFAMLADLYFNNAFLYFSNAFFGDTYQIINDQTKNRRQKGVSSITSEHGQGPVFEVFDDQPDPKPNDIGSPKNEIANPTTDHDENYPQKDKENKGHEENNKLPDSQDNSRDSHKELTESSNKRRPDTKKDLNDGDTADSDSVLKVPLPPVSAEEKKSKPPRIAIIIDDMGYDPKIADSISRIDKNITISILPGSPFGRRIAQTLHSRGTQIMLHLPMEPLQYPSVNPGHGAILSDMTPDNVLTLLNKNLESVPHAIGVNNHMGSRLTTLSVQMVQIFEILKQKNLFFIDSLTSNQSSGIKSARQVNLSFASRDIFLDNIKDKAYIKKQFRELIRMAKQNGTSIAIGHPYNETYIVLKEEIPSLPKNIKLVPVSELVTIKE
ncbi:MAG: divergent polysaccharide deacetylase family protein [Desulfamplus sp.]|nr:divergent polysaccharide deacetylase family protein [Desulfamplus sp.]